MGDPDASEHGLTIESVDWLPSGGRSGLVRVRGRHLGEDAPLPELVVEHAGEVHRHASLPDPRAGREPGRWRGAYVVHAADVQAEDARLRLELPDGARIALPRPVPAHAQAPAEPGGADVVDRAVLAERRARRAEAAEQAQARIAREALKAVEVLELRAAQLEERLEAAGAERDALSARAGQFPAPDPEVAELRARLGQAEAEVRALREREAAPRPAGSIEEAERRADRLRDALTTAISTVGELRLRLHESRVRSRTAEIAHAAEAVRLRVLASERSAVTRELEALRRDASEAEQLRTIQAAEIERVTARAAGAEAAHEETRRRLGDQAGELRAARERIASLEAELAGLRAEIPTRIQAALDRQETELAARQDAAERDFAAREAQAQQALSSARVELERVEAALVRAETDRELSRAAAAAAQMKLRAADVAHAAGSPLVRDQSAALEAAALAAELATARAERDAQAAELESARAQIEAQSAKLLATSTLEAELQRARELLATQSEALEAVRAKAAEDDAAVVAGLTAELDASRESVRTLGNELDELRSRTASLAAELEAERERRQTVEAELATERERERIPPPPPVPPDLPARAAEQEQAAAAEPPAEPVRLLADLDAAAAALRARAPVPEPAAGEEPPAVETPVKPARGPAITSPAEPPPVRVATGRGARDYPSLRGALVKLAHDDPAAAAKLIVGLLPAQWRVVEEPVDYDVTIAEAGTYAVTVTAGRARVRRIADSRPEAEFHLRADALTLAEMVAGVGPKPRRFGRAKVGGRTRRAKVLQPIASATLSLPEAVRAGARLEPELVLRTLAYAVHPTWTAGHDFTIAHTFTGPKGDETLYITARDGRGLTVSHESPPEPPSATVVISRRAFAAMLAGDPPPPGERPATRGDHRAAQTLRSWADRARAGA